jgi:hypothetical protein
MPGGGGEESVRGRGLSSVTSCSALSLCLSLVIPTPFDVYILA